MRKKKDRITNRVARFRASFGKGRLSQAELARRIGVSRYYISKLEQGTLEPGGKVMFKIARFFCRPIEDIFDFKQENK